MACGFPSIVGFADFLVWPTSCFHYFWLSILLVLMILTAWRVYKAEEKRRAEGDLISAFAVSSLGYTIIAIFGTLVTSSGDLPMITTDIILYLLAITIPLNLLWIFKKR